MGCRNDVIRGEIELASKSFVAAVILTVFELPREVHHRAQVTIGFGLGVSASYDVRCVVLSPFFASTL